MIWIQADQGYQNIPHPIENGYEKNSEDKLHAKLMSQGVSAPKVLNEFICDCPENACSVVFNKYTCLINSQSYTSACECRAFQPEVDVPDICCTNPFTMEALPHSNESDSD